MSDGNRRDVPQARLSRQQLVLIALGVVLCIALAPLLADFVRDIIAVPLLWLLWAAGLLFDTVPQALILLLFVLAAALVARRSLLRNAPLQRSRPAPTHYPGRLELWAHLASASGEGDNYARWRLAHRIANLALEALSYRTHQTPAQLRQQIERGTLDLPPAMQAYLRVGLTNYNPFTRSHRFLLRVPWRQTAEQPRDPLDYDPAQILALLETTLGVTGGNNYDS